MASLQNLAQMLTPERFGEAPRDSSPESIYGQISQAINALIDQIRDPVSGGAGERFNHRYFFDYQRSVKEKILQDQNAPDERK